MNKLGKAEILQWSNGFFIIPLLIAFAYNIPWYGIVLLGTTLVSLNFHFFSEAKEAYYLDVLFSIGLMISNFVLLFMGYWKLPFSFIAVLLAGIALVFYFRRSRKNYYLNHSLWHFFSSTVCIFCLLTFLSFTQAL